MFLGVNWPILSAPWTDNPVGLDAGFYNRVCLPLFAFLALVMAVCPWFGQKKGIHDKTGLGMAIGVGLVSAVTLYALGYTQPVALLGAVAGIMIIVSVALLFVRSPAVRSFRPSWGAYGVHLGMAFMVVGVAFSGAYKEEAEAMLSRGQSMTAGDYMITFQELIHDHDNPAMDMHEARLTVTRDGQAVGELTPQKRLYRNFEQSSFAEVSVIPSLGEEVYATLLAFNEEGAISLKISVNPLVNWIWIGGTLCCLVAFLGWRKIERR